MAKKNKKIKDPNKKSKAPFILLPISMVTKKLSKITCVVDNENFPFFIFVFLGKF
jgi:hypothetical protein